MRERTNVAIDVVSDINLDAIRKTSHELLDRHEVGYVLEYYKDRHPQIEQADGIAESLSITISQYSLIKLMVGAAAIRFGLVVGKVVGKILESAASDLGKDLYKWLKKSVLTLADDYTGKRAYRERRASDYVCQLIHRCSGTFLTGEAEETFSVQLRFHELKEQLMEQIFSHDVIEDLVDCVYGKTLPFAIGATNITGVGPRGTSLLVRVECPPIDTDPWVTLILGKGVLYIDVHGMLEIDLFSQRRLERVWDSYRIRRLYKKLGPLSFPLCPVPLRRYA